MQKPVARLIPADTALPNLTAIPAPRWTNLFYRDSGWFGADGIFSIPLSGSGQGHKTDSIMLVFSDTMIGKIKDNKLQPGSKMVHNSVAYMKNTTPDKDAIHFCYAKDEKGAPQSLFIPRTLHAQPGDYYWLGAGFENRAQHKDIYIFAYRMANKGSGAWSFRQVGNTIIVLKAGSRPPFPDQRQVETPFFTGGDEEVESGSLGAGIFANTKAAGAPHPDGYLYVYGVRGRKKNLIVARVHPADFERFDRWRFWDGSTWSRGMEKARAVTDSVSNELSVSPTATGKYALVFQVNGMGSSVGLRLGATPYGPFGPVVRIWQCEEPRHKNYFTYNAKAHPALSAPGELLISYNVNAFNFLNELDANPHLYRPRFIRLQIP